MNANKYHLIISVLRGFLSAFSAWFGIFGNDSVLLLFWSTVFLCQVLCKVISVPSEQSFLLSLRKAYESVSPALYLLSHSSKTASVKVCRRIKIGSFGDKWVCPPVPFRNRCAKLWRLRTAGSYLPVGSL